MLPANATELCAPNIKDLVVCLPSDRPHRQSRRSVEFMHTRTFPQPGLPQYFPQNVDNDCCLILSVDDDLRLLCTRQAILEQAGYEVLSAKDGIEALSLFRAHPVDLVLLDYVMPNLYGSV